MRKFTLRFLDEEEALHKAITQSAVNSRRSLNNEILRAIEFYLRNAPEAHYSLKDMQKEEAKRKPKSP